MHPYRDEARAPMVLDLLKAELEEEVAKLNKEALERIRKGHSSMAEQAATKAGLLEDVLFRIQALEDGRP